MNGLLWAAGFYSFAIAAAVLCACFDSRAAGIAMAIFLVATMVAMLAGWFGRNR